MRGTGGAEELSEREATGDTMSLALITALAIASNCILAAIDQLTPDYGLLTIILCGALYAYEFGKTKGGE